MSPDYNRAAVRAAEVLVRHQVSRSPVSPLPILEHMDNVIVMSFEEMSDASNIRPFDLVQIFGSGKDAVTSIHTRNGRPCYFVGYNSLLPFGLIQHALAREMGHIVLGHTESNKENTEEALCFALHLLCPRPLIHAIQATSIRLTKDLFAQLTGAHSQYRASLRRIPATDVPPGLNRFVRSQFMPFILNFFECYRAVMPDDGSALVDLGTYMDGYQE